MVPEPSGSMEQRGADGQLVGHRRSELSVERQRRAGLGQWVHHGTGQHLAHRVTEVFERRHDPEVAAATLNAQKRSGCSSALAVITSPSAVTISAERRLSTVRPYLPMSHPMPPPRVSPAIPVLETTPPVVASPWMAVAQLNSLHVSPGSARLTRRRGSTWMPHLRQVDHQPAVADGVEDAVTAASHLRLDASRRDRG